jgi:integrase
MQVDTSPEAWVFPSERLTTPLRKDNCWRRHFAPQLKAAGLDRVNFHVMRKTHCSLMQELGVDPKVRADQIGHTLDVNENVYTITALHQRREAVNRLEAALKVILNQFPRLFGAQRLHHVHPRRSRSRHQ